MPHVFGESRGILHRRKSVCSAVAELACMLLDSYCMLGKARSLLSRYIKVGEKR